MAKLQACRSPAPDVQNPAPVQGAVPVSVHGVCNFKFPIGRTVRTFKLVSRRQKCEGLSRAHPGMFPCAEYPNPDGHGISLCARCNRRGLHLALATKFNAEVIGCHGFSPRRSALFLDEGEKHISALPSNM